MSKQNNNGLTATLTTLSEESTAEYIKIGKILKPLNRRGFGPLLIAPCLLTILPTGAVPGVPAICGIFIFLISIQIVLGRRHPWLPERLKDYSIETKRFKSGIEKIKPYTKIIDRHVHNRWSFLIDNEISKRLIAATTVVLSLCMITIGFIPMLPAVLALPILFFGTGLSVHDGVLMAIGYATLIAFLCIMPWVFFE